MSQRLRRLVKLLDLLYAGRVHSTAWLAEMFQCSRRTVFRDLATLRDAGIEIHFNSQDEAYMIPSSQRRNWSGLSEVERQTVVLAVATSPLRWLGRFTSTLETAVAKITAPARDSERRRYTKLLRSVEQPHSPSDGIGNPAVAQLLEAISQGIWTGLAVVLEEVDGSCISTVLSIQQLVMSHESWHLIGASSWHGAIVRLDIKRVQKIILPEYPNSLELCWSVNDAAVNNAAAV